MQFANCGYVVFCIIPYYYCVNNFVVATAGNTNVMSEHSDEEESFGFSTDAERKKKRKRAVKASPASRKSTPLPPLATAKSVHQGVSAGVASSSSSVDASLLERIESLEKRLQEGSVARSGPSSGSGAEEALAAANRKVADLEGEMQVLKESLKEQMDLCSDITDHRDALISRSFVAQTLSWATKYILQSRYEELNDITTNMMEDFTGTNKDDPKHFTMRFHRNGKIEFLSPLDLEAGTTTVIRPAFPNRNPPVAVENKGAQSTSATGADGAFDSEDCDLV